MVDLRTYLTCVGMNPANSGFTYSYGGNSYSYMLIKSGTTISSNITSNNILLAHTAKVSGNYNAYVPDGIKTYEFILPDTIGYASIIDGTIFGNITYLLDTTNHFDAILYATDTEIDILTIDSDGNETSLIGGYQSILTSNVTSSDGSDVTLVLPYWFDVPEFEVDYNDRILLRIKSNVEVDGSAADNGDYGKIWLSVSYSDNDILARIPFVL